MGIGLFCHLGEVLQVVSFRPVSLSRQLKGGSPFLGPVHFHPTANPAIGQPLCSLICWKLQITPTLTTGHPRFREPLKMSGCPSGFKLQNKGHQLQEREPPRKGHPFLKRHMHPFQGMDHFGRFGELDRFELDPCLGMAPRKRNVPSKKGNPPKPKKVFQNRARLS